MEVTDATEARVPPTTSTRLPLEGAYNFRDLGGLQGYGGRRIPNRRVFRADRLTRLTEADTALLESLSIGRVFDLRWSRSRSASRMRASTGPRSTCRAAISKCSTKARR
jgi:hypothetical protein